MIVKNRQYVQFCAYGFLKNLRFFDAFLILFFVDKGLSFTEIGSLYALREIMVNVVEIPSGVVADTYGRKRSLVFSFCLYLLSFGTFYRATGYWPLMAAMLLYGIGDAFRSGTHKGMIMDYLKLQGWSDHKVDYYGHTRAWSQRGSAISAFIAGVLVYLDGDYSRIFLYSMGPYLLNFINIATYPKALNYSLTEAKAKPSMLATFRSYWQVMKQPRLLAVIHSAAIHGAFMGSVKDYIQPLMVQLSLLIPILLDTDPTKKSGLMIGGLYFLIYQLTSFASRKSAWLASQRRFDAVQGTLLLGLASGLICGFFYEWELWTAAIIPFVMIYLIENIRKPILTGAIADAVPGELLTTVLSSQSFWETLLTAGLSLLLGVLVDALGLGWSLIYLSGALLLGSLLRMRFYPMKSR